MERLFRFYKNARHEWYVDLPEWEQDPTELQMVEGADTFLDRIAGSDESIELKMADEPFSGAELLTLVRERDPVLKGGADYLLECYGGNIINHQLWLCAITKLVFHKLPEKIWFVKLDDKAKRRKQKA